MLMWALHPLSSMWFSMSELNLTLVSEYRPFSKIWTMPVRDLYPFEMHLGFHGELARRPELCALFL